MCSLYRLVERSTAQLFASSTGSPAGKCRSRRDGSVLEAAGHAERSLRDAARTTDPAAEDGYRGEWRGRIGKWTVYYYFLYI